MSELGGIEVSLSEVEDILYERVEDLTVYPTSLTQGMSREEIHYQMMKMNYEARKYNGFDVTDHPYLTLSEIN